MNLYFLILKNTDGYWVVAESLDKACEKLRKVLDDNDIYFISERELKHIDIIGKEYYDKDIFMEVD